MTFEIITIIKLISIIDKVRLFILVLMRAPSDAHLI